MNKDYYSAQNTIIPGIRTPHQDKEAELAHLCQEALDKSDAEAAKREQNIRDGRTYKTNPMDRY
jgi:hypothetical protein